MGATCRNPNQRSLAGVAAGDRAHAPVRSGAIMHHQRRRNQQPSPSEYFQAAIKWAGSPTDSILYFIYLLHKLHSWTSSTLAGGKRIRDACMQIDTKIHDVTHLQRGFKSKKSIKFKICIQIKFRLHHYLSYDKIFKIRPQLPIFPRYFLKYFLILNN